MALLIPAMMLYCSCMVSGNDEIKEKKIGGKRMCDQGWECKMLITNATCLHFTNMSFFKTELDVELKNLYHYSLSSLDFSPPMLDMVCVASPTCTSVDVR